VVVVVVVCMHIRTRARGEGQSQKTPKTEPLWLGFGYALSNGGVGRWREVVGWCGRGGSGGGRCAFECV
jgi:hypothetical protein